MKKYLISLLFICHVLTSAAQSNSTLYQATIENKEYSIYMIINLYKSTITIPGQEILGTTYGYMGDRQDSRKWIIVSAQIKADKALLTFINDYGSEDLTATLTVNKDHQYILEQKSGSTLKIVRNRKWLKLPTKLIFTLNQHLSY